MRASVYALSEASDSTTQLEAERHFQVFCRIPDTWAPFSPFARMPEIGQRHFRGGLGYLILGFPIIILCLGAHQSLCSFCWIRLKTCQWTQQQALVTTPTPKPTPKFRKLPRGSPVGLQKSRKRSGGSSRHRERATSRAWGTRSSDLKMSSAYASTLCGQAQHLWWVAC